MFDTRWFGQPVQERNSECSGHFGRLQSLTAFANTSGCTGPEPASRRAIPTAVSVQRESTAVVDEQHRASGRPDPRTANAPSTLRTCCALFSISLWGGASPGPLHDVAERQAQLRGEPRREVGHERRAASRGRTSPTRVADRAATAGSGRRTPSTSSSDTTPPSRNDLPNLAAPAVVVQQAERTRPGASWRSAAILPPAFLQPGRPLLPRLDRHEAAAGGTRARPRPGSGRGRWSSGVSGAVVAATARRDARIVELGPQELHEAPVRVGVRRASPACSARRGAVTASTRSSAYSHGSRVRCHRPSARSTAPSTSRIFSIASSRDCGGR